jgi:hypothetical protein
MKKKYECWQCAEVVAEERVDMWLDNDEDLGLAASDRENRKKQFVVCKGCNR